MSLYDSPSYFVVGGETDELPQLPAPWSAAGLTHQVINSRAAATVWTAGPGTPFVTGGVASSSLTIPAGGVAFVQSDGSHWLVQPVVGGGRRVFAQTGVTDASGEASFAFVTPFAGDPVVSAALESDTDGAAEVRVVSRSESGCVVRVRSSAAVDVAGTLVLQAPQPLEGATVHLLAFGSGTV